MTLDTPTKIGTPSKIPLGPSGPGSNAGKPPTRSASVSNIPRTGSNSVNGAPLSRTLPKIGQGQTQTPSRPSIGGRNGSVAGSIRSLSTTHSFARSTPARNRVASLGPMKSLSTSTATTTTANTPPPNPKTIKDRPSNIQVNITPPPATSRLVPPSIPSPSDTATPLAHSPRTSSHSQKSSPTILSTTPSRRSGGLARSPSLMVVSESVSGTASPTKTATIVNTNNRTPDVTPRKQTRNTPSLSSIQTQLTPSPNPPRFHPSPNASNIDTHNMPGVPWSSSGALTATNTDTNPFLATPARGSKGKGIRKTNWERGTDNGRGDGFGYGDELGYGDGEYGEEDGDGNMTFDMVTDIDGDVDDEMQAALDAVANVYIAKTTHYKQLLTQAQTSSASQLHALQAEIQHLRDQLEAERVVSKTREEEARALRLKQSHRGPMVDGGAQGGFDIISAMRGDGHGGFDEGEIRRVIRGLKQADRMRLINLILDACLPGDIPLMISLLQKYAKSSFDILAHLPPTLSSHILSLLSIPELLKCEGVSTTWRDMCRDEGIWRGWCLWITRFDPVKVKEPMEKEGGWRGLYRRLHSREENWSLGLAQNMRFLKGHTGFCTTLSLNGRRLISGSYDETIRVWDIDTGEQKKCLKVKAVSCLDFLDEQETFAVGFHDVGRVQVFSSLTWTLLQTLQGHLYGIRAVALSPAYLVSAGADKAIVAWDWRAGTKIVRFGQQTNLNIGVQIVDEERIVSVTIDGIVRTFSIRRREMLAQFKLSELTARDTLSSIRLSTVGVGPNNMLQWFAAKGQQMTCATKSVILHLEWSTPTPTASATSTSAKDSVDFPTPPSIGLSPVNSIAPHPRAVSSLSNANKRPSLSSSSSSPMKLAGSGTSTPRRSSGYGALRPSSSPRSSLGFGSTSPNPGLASSKLRAEYLSEEALTAPPRLVAVVETPDVAVGAVDPRKRRVATSTRFSSRLGADRRIFVSTYTESDPLDPDAPSAEILYPSPPSTSSSLPDTPVAPFADYDSASVTEVGGAWEALVDEMAVSRNAAEVGHGTIPSGFKGLAMPNMNPMAMALSHEEVVVGCADGTIYVMSFVGYKYSATRLKGDNPMPIREDEDMLLHENDND